MDGSSPARTAADVLRLQPPEFDGHILDMRPLFAPWLAGQNPGAIRLTYF
jgi:hypothetical protein